MEGIPNGILGAVKGRVEPVAGYTRNGVNIIHKAHANHDGKANRGASVNAGK